MTELAVIQKENVPALFETNGCDPILDQIKAKVAEFSADVSTKKGRDNIKSMAHKVARSKTYLDGLGKDLVATMKDKCRVVDAERRRLREELDSLKEGVRKPLTDWEAADAKRVADIQAKIREFTYTPLSSTAASSEHEAVIAAMTAWTITETEYQEFFEIATRKKAEALAALQKCLDSQLAFEKKQADLKTEQKRQKEAAEKQRRQQTSMDAIAEINTRISDSLSYSLESLKGALTSLGNLQITEEVFFDRIPEAESVKAKALEHFEKLIVQKKAEAKAAAANEAERKRLADLAEKQAEKEARERIRQTTVNNALDSIPAELEGLHLYTSAGVLSAIASLEGHQITEAIYYDQVDRATRLKTSTLAQMKEVLAHKQKVELEEKKLQEERAVLKAQQEAEADRKEAEERERVRKEDEAAAKLKEEEEAKEEAERLERLRPDRARLASVADSISRIIEAFPEVEEPECVKLRNLAILRLGEVRELLSGE
jgi:hypothetical protein